MKGLSSEERKWLLRLVAVSAAVAFLLPYLLSVCFYAGVGAFLCLFLLFPALCLWAGKLAGRHIPQLWGWPFVPPAMILLSLWASARFAWHPTLLLWLIPGFLYWVLGAFSFWGL